jgi:hypothetical protein
VRFSKAVDFAIPFCLPHRVAWPATLQLILRNEAKHPFIELRRSMLSQRFQKRRIIPSYFGLVHKPPLDIPYSLRRVAFPCLGNCGQQFDNVVQLRPHDQWENEPQNREGHYNEKLYHAQNWIDCAASD